MSHADHALSARSIAISHTARCAPIVAVGLLVTSGWLLHSVPMITVGTGLSAMVFNVGLCFMLSGAALALAGHNGQIARRLRTKLAVITLLFACATLYELLTDNSLGIDFPLLHTWYFGDKGLGRMAPDSAIGFILTSLGILLADRITTKTRAVGAVVLTFAVLAIGLTGLFGYTLAPDLVFGWIHSSRMSIGTSLGMILCSVALRQTWSSTDWYQSQRFLVEDQKIRLLAVATVVVATLFAGMCGFVFMQHELRKSLGNRFEHVIVKHRASLFDALQRESTIAVAVSGLDEAGLDEALTNGTVSAVQWKDATGHIERVWGHPSTAPFLTVPLPAGPQVDLLWEGRSTVRSTLPRAHDGTRNGTVVIEQSAAAVDQAIFDTKQLGKSGEIALCAPRQGALSCIHGTRHARPFTIAVPLNAEQRLLFYPGLTGDLQLEVTVSDAGKNVILGRETLVPGTMIVVEEDAAEAYAEVREALTLGAPLLLLISVLGGTLALFQLRPLTRRLVTSEARAHERELQMRSILESVGEGILTFDNQGTIQEVNAAAGDIFGYDIADLVGHSTDMLLPERKEGSLPALAHRSRGRSIQLLGQRKGGNEFPIEVTITETTSSEHPSFVAVVRDITERTETERRLTALAQYDSLTALPNRALFLERLAAAAIRLDKTGAAFALMFIDVDGFKEVNDRWGHRAGDDLLIQIAARLRDAVRISDTVARLAGDEFTVIAEFLSSPMSDARGIADKIVTAMERPFFLSSREVNVTVSLGLIVQEIRGLPTADLLARADAAMYAAKRAGRNR